MYCTLDTMSLLIKLMDAVLLLTTAAVLPIILPLYLIFKLLRRVKRTIFSENLAGKVVLITGASSGIGEYLAYEYARRGARLALAARREDRLQAVAKQARELGSPDVIVVRADVSRAENCERFVDEAVSHFGQLDHLVNNAGIIRASLLEDCKDVSNFADIMDINFWGSVHCTHSALPHLKRSKGKIVVIGSIAAWTPLPKMSFYTASKAAMLSFFETLRVELGSDIGVTIVSPGAVKTEIVTAEFLTEFGQKSVPVPMESTQVCAKAIVDSTCRGDRYLTIPSGTIVTFLFKVVCSEVMEWFFRWTLRILKKQAQ